jgi:hypothetical protein
MALSAEAIIAMLALFVACLPGLRFLIAYYQSKVKRGRNGIQTPGLPSATLNYITLVPFALDEGHDTRGISTYLMYSGFLLLTLAGGHHAHPSIPESYEINAILFNSFASESESMDRSSHGADHYLPPHCIFSSPCTKCYRGLMLRYWDHKLELGSFWSEE